MTQESISVAKQFLLMSHGFLFGPTLLFFRERLDFIEVVTEPGRCHKLHRSLAHHILCICWAAQVDQEFNHQIVTTSSREMHGRILHILRFEIWVFALSDEYPDHIKVAISA